MPTGRLYVRVRLTWWADALIRLYQWWIWVCPRELTIEDVEWFVDWLDRKGGYLVEGPFIKEDDNGKGDT